MAIKKPEFKYPAVMLVDDNEIDNFINIKMIEAINFAEKIWVHTSGKSGLEFLRNLERAGKAADLLFPTFIFLDINMPMMDGFQFLEEFKKFKYPINNTGRIRMLSTSLNPSDKVRSMKHEYVADFIVKPLTTESLNLL